MYGILPDKHMPAGDIVRGALDYWERIRGDRRMPARADLDPMEIVPLLPYVMLVDVLYEPLDFRFRLLGTAHDQITSGDYRGRCFSELPHTAPGNPIWAQYAQVVAEQRPVHAGVSYIGPDEFLPRQLEHCLMPLSLDDRKVDMVFVAAAIPRPHLPSEA